MKTSEALKLVGGLSKPSKMPGGPMVYQQKNARPGPNWLKFPGSTCEGCYALKGCYVFKVVQEAQYRSYWQLYATSSGLGPWLC